MHLVQYHSRGSREQLNFQNQSRGGSFERNQLLPVTVSSSGRTRIRGPVRGKSLSPARITSDTEEVGKEIESWNSRVIPIGSTRWTESIRINELEKRPRDESDHSGSLKTSPDTVTLLCVRGVITICRRVPGKRLLEIARWPGF